MTSFRQKSVGLVIIAFFSAFSYLGADSKNTQEAKQETVACPLGVHIFVPHSGELLVGTPSEYCQQEKEWTLVLVNPVKGEPKPLMAPTLTLNEQRNIVNPVYGTPISKLSITSNGKPVFTCDRFPSTLFLLEQYGLKLSEHKLYSLQITKATTKKTPEAVTIKSFGIVPYIDSKTINQQNFFFAVAPKGKAFGEAGSGIVLHTAIISEAPVENNEEEKEKQQDEQEEYSDDITESNKLKAQKKGEKEEEALIVNMSLEELHKKKLDLNHFVKVTRGTQAVYNRLMPLTYDSELLGSRTAPVREISFSENALFWYNPLRLFFITLTLKTGEQGGRALLIGSFNETGLVLREAVGRAMLGENSCIGTSLPDQTVSIHHTASMHTSLGLSYMIGVGGVGDPEATRKLVYALPLITYGEKNTYGMIAKKDQAPAAVINQHGEFRGRSFTVPVGSPEDMPAYTDRPVMVGGGAAPGPVTQLSVQGDLVIISVSEPTIDHVPGLFSSRALYDEYGRIVQWTRWQRVAGTKPVTKFYTMPTAARITCVTPVISDTEKYPTVAFYTTRWDDEAAESSKNVKDRSITTNYSHFTTLSGLINARFNQAAGGIRSLCPLPMTAPGLSQQLGKRLSGMIVVGKNRLMLVQTGRDDEQGRFGPSDSWHLYTKIPAHQFTQETTRENRSILLMAPELTQLGTLTSATLVVGKRYGWLAVAGTEGVALLARPDGTGWPVNTVTGLGLGDGFEGITPDMKFYKIGTHQAPVLKIAAVHDILFMLTSTHCERMSITPERIREGLLMRKKVILTSKQEEKAEKNNKLVSSTSHVRGRYLMDMLVSPQVILVATSAGIYYAQLPAQEKNLEWHELMLPQLGRDAGVCSFSAQGPSGFEYDWYLRGTISLIAGSPIRDNAQVYRATVTPDRHVLLLPDMSPLYIRSYFLGVGAYRHFIMGDGAFYFFTGSYGDYDAPSVEMVVQDFTANVQHIGQRRVVKVFPHADFIGPVVREPASGALMFWGDFGIRMLS